MTELATRWVALMRASKNRSMGQEVTAEPFGATFDALGLLLVAEMGQDAVIEGMTLCPENRGGWLPRQVVHTALRAAGFLRHEDLATTLTEMNDAHETWAAMARLVESWPRRVA